ncbi:unnamed protein product [Effrenium voratum]|nr:unnamed protein product [Effrenium voratum]
MLPAGSRQSFPAFISALEMPTTSHNKDHVAARDELSEVLWKKAGKVSTGPEEVAKKPPMMIAAALQNLECQVKIILEQTQQLQAELEALKSSSSDAQLQADKVADLQVRVTWLERMVAREFQ